MRFSRLSLCVAAWLLGPCAALAQTTPACIAPSPPPPESARPAKVAGEPPAPRCVNLETHVARCPRGVIERYNDDINAYNARVADWNRRAADYVDALNTWTRAAGKYGQCEIDLMNRETPH